MLALPLGVVEFTFLVTAISTGTGLAITLIGIPILVGTLYAWRRLAGFERSLIGRLTGVRIPTPYRPDPSRASWWQRAVARLGDPATWKDLAFLLLQLPMGIVAFTVTVVVLGNGVAALLAPAYHWAIRDGSWVGPVRVDSLGEALAVMPLGALLLLFGIPALGALGRLYAWFASQLLGSNADPALTAQVTDLQDARSRIIAAADAERRRIERDLHDGAQQRLVALALNLRLAEQRAAGGDPSAAELVRSAGEEAQLALKELRDLARGIHPAILTNRGLPAALEDLASRSTVPVTVLAAPDERLPDAVEAAAYFVVSECLANVGKHAQAGSASVSVTAAGGHLTAVVADDGVGGAALDGGSGIQGLLDRVGALNGTIAVDSPPGEGTRVTATIPLDAEDPRPAGAPEPLRPESAAARRERRIRGLRVRARALGLLAGVLVVVWALTDPGLPWIVWPLLGLGLVAALDAWRVLYSPPLETSRLRRFAGTLVIVDLFLVGIWLASGSAHFWPAWPLLGSVCLIGLGTLAAREP